MRKIETFLLLITGWYSTQRQNKKLQISLSFLDVYGTYQSFFKVAGVKVYPRQNQNIRPHAVTACISKVMSRADFS